MKLNFLIENLDSFSLRKKVNDIIKAQGFCDAMINHYNLDEVELDRAIEDLDTYSFLTPKKVVVIDNINNLSSDDKFSVHFLNYLDQENADVLLIMTVKKLDTRKKISKELKAKTTYIKEEVDPRDLIKNSLKDYKMGNNVIKLLIDYTKGDITRIYSECQKLREYASDTKEISENDIKELVIKKLGDQDQILFSLIKHISDKNKKLALTTYSELLDHHIDPLSIISLLDSQMRLMIQVKLLAKDHLSNDEIAEKLEVHPFRVQKTKEISYGYNQADILIMIKSLHAIDYKIKSGIVDSKIALEMFLISL